MGFINVVLDDQVSYGFEGGPEYSTGEVDLENGLQVRNALWARGRHRYSAAFKDIDETVRDYLIEVFHACRGKFHSFMFKDWNDYTATDEPLAVAEGTTDTVQLYKTYTFGDAYTVRPIQALATAQVREVGAAPGEFVAGVLDLTTGEFTPDEPWGAGPYQWSGEFYVWVHFKDDYNALTINNWRNHTATIDLEEDKRRVTATNMPASWDE